MNPAKFGYRNSVKMSLLPSPLDQSPSELGKCYDEVRKNLGKYLVAIYDLNAKDSTLPERFRSVLLDCLVLGEWTRDLVNISKCYLVTTNKYNLYPRDAFDQAGDKGLALYKQIETLGSAFSQIIGSLEKVICLSTPDYRRRWLYQKIKLSLRDIESNLEDPTHLKKIKQDVKKIKPSSTIEAIIPSKEDIRSLKVKPIQLKQPDSVTLPDDPKWLHNISILANHLRDNLEVDDSGLLQVYPEKKPSLIDKLINFVPNIFRSIHHFYRTRILKDFFYTIDSTVCGLLGTKNITLLGKGYNADLVRTCTAETIRRTEEFIREGKISSTISHIELHSETSELDPKFVDLLQTLYLYGVTPFSHKELLVIKELSLENLNLPDDLRDFLKLLKFRIEKLENHFKDLEEIEYLFSLLGLPNQMDRKGWDHICREVLCKLEKRPFFKKYDSDSSKVLYELDILLGPWKAFNKLCNKVIESDCVRQHLPLQCCREISVEKFTNDFSNLFSYYASRYFHLEEVSPDLHAAGKELFKAKSAFRNIQG